MKILERKKGIMSLLTFLGMHNWSHTIAIFTFPCIYSRVSDFFPKGLLFIQDNMYMLNIGCPKLQTILLPRMYNICITAFFVFSLFVCSKTFWFSCHFLMGKFYRHFLCSYHGDSIEYPKVKTTWFEFKPT